MNRENTALSQLTGSALKWNYAGVAVRSILSLLIGVVLARLLGPKPFGLVAIAVLIIGFGNILSDFGFGNAVIQRATLSNEDIRFVFTFQMLLGIGFAIACYISAAFIGGLFHSEAVVPVIRALSLMFPLQALGQTAMSLLRRQLRYRVIQLTQISSYMVNVFLAIPLAVLGYGVWALVIAQLLSVLLSSVIVYSITRHSLVPCFRINWSICKFGLKVVGTNVANWSIGNLDNAFVGRAFGVVPLGLYSRAFQLTNSPIIAVVTALQSVLFSAYSRANDRVETIKRVYLSTVTVVAVTLLPMFAAGAAASYTIIIVLYGKAWLAAVPLFVPLALAMPLYALLALVGPVLWAAGKVEKELKVQAFSAVLAVAVFAVASRFSVVCLAWGVFAVYAFRFVGMTREMVLYFKITWREIGIALQGGVFLALLVSASVWILEGLMVRVELPPVARLSLDIICAFSVLIIPLAMAPDKFLGLDADLVLTRIRQMLPQSLRGIVPHSRLQRKVAYGSQR
jgi:PST family polysaccharide transporter